jgi:hypothetical protein
MMRKKTLIALLALTALAAATPSFAGPPFTCHVFEIGSAKSLPWGGNDNWLGMRDDYDFHHVVADTEALLTPSTPTLVRMETLRRASLYASRDRAVAEQLIAAMMSRVHTADQVGQPMALFDAGYVIEALSEIEQFGNHMKQLAGSERVLAGLTHPLEARPLLEKSAALRPGDASIEFALALISRASETEAHLRKARTAAREDSLLASNLAKLQMQ